MQLRMAVTRRVDRMCVSVTRGIAAGWGRRGKWITRKLGLGNALVTHGGLGSVDVLSEPPGSFANLPAFERARRGVVRLQMGLPCGRKTSPVRGRGCRGFASKLLDPSFPYLRSFRTKQGSCRANRPGRLLQSESKLTFTSKLHGGRIDSIVARLISWQSVDRGRGHLVAGRTPG